MLTPQDLESIEAIVQRNRPSSGDGGGGCLLLLFILFLLGVFKGCGYQ